MAGVTRTVPVCLLGDAKHIGPTLQKYRRSIRMSQSQLCRNMGVHVSTMSGYERGRKQPGSDVLVRWVAALGLQLWVHQVPREGE